MNVAELLKEKEKWEKVLEDAKVAREKIKQLQRMIVLMADYQEMEDFAIASPNGRRQHSVAFKMKVAKWVHNHPDESIASIGKRFDIAHTLVRSWYNKWAEGALDG